EDAAAVLLGELAPAAGADAGLVALDVAVGQRLAAELHAAVAVLGRQLDPQRQAEVAGHHLADQELIALQARAGADDLAVLDLPQPRVALPAGQVLAVEERADV